MVKNITFSVLLLLLTIGVYGQQSITGRIIDKKSESPIVGATIRSINNKNIGTISDNSGYFVLHNNCDTIQIQSIGYITKICNTKNKKELGEIKLTTSNIGLEEVKIMANIVTKKDRPFAISTIPEQRIIAELGSQEFPRLLENTPGIFAPRGGGGYGDSHIFIRGFDQPNIAVMVNGVPINEMQQGEVYWNNWSGIFDAVSTIQIQRGLGASRVAINSVGGTVNIITKTPESTSGGFLQHSFTDFGQQKTVLGLSSGKLKNDWAISFVGSRISGDGYIDGTQVDGWAYFLTATKNFNPNHSININTYGSPQTHGQRQMKADIMLSQEEHFKYGKKYNKAWGYLGGEILYEDEHYYYKPQFTINDYLKISEKHFLSTTIYYSSGDGKGKGLNTTHSNLPTSDYQNLINWDNIVATNSNNIDTIAARQNGWYTTDNNDTTFQSNANIMFHNSCYNHQWYGIISTLSSKVGENIKITSGFDGRDYLGHQFREVRDLLGADYYNAGFSNNHAVEGDKISFNNKAHITYAGLFGQVEFDKAPFYAFLSATISNSWYKFEDLMYPQTDETKKTKQIPSYSFKGGFSFSPNQIHTLYLNGGYSARAPYYPFVFINWGQNMNDDATTEKISSAEIGYRFEIDNFSSSINAYYNLWSDRWMYGSYAGLDFYQNVYFKGITEQHAGIEIDLRWNFNKFLSLETYGSFANWIYKNDVSVDVYNNETLEKEGTYHAYTNNLKVPNAPQTQIGGAIRYKSPYRVELLGQINYNADQYSSFNPSSRTNPDEKNIQAFKIPDYATMDISLSYFFKISDLECSTAINCYNIFDKDYISEGFDGSSHNIDTFRGYWGFGRNFNFSLRVNF